jgi:hypothetical protein
MEDLTKAPLSWDDWLQKRKDKKQADNLTLQGVDVKTYELYMETDFILDDELEVIQDYCRINETPEWKTHCVLSTLVGFKQLDVVLNLAHKKVAQLMVDRARFKLALILRKAIPDQPVMATPP